MEKSQRKKLRLLCGIAATPALLKWHKPILSSVVLPAHAQTSILAPGTFVFPGRSVSVCNGTSRTPICFSINDSDVLAPSIDMSGNPLDVCITFHSGLAVPTAPEAGHSLSIVIEYPFTGGHGLFRSVSELELLSLSCFGGSGSGDDLEFPFEQEQVRGGVRGTVNGTAYAVRGTITSQGQSIIMSDLLFIPQF